MDKDKARAAFKADMRKEMPMPGYLAAYLAWMRKEDPKAADMLETDLVTLMSSEIGLRVMKLFEKSVLNFPMPNGADDCALREFSAVRNFVLEIRRIDAHGAQD